MPIQDFAIFAHVLSEDNFLLAQDAYVGLSQLIAILTEFSDARASCSDHFRRQSAAPGRQDEGSFEFGRGLG